MPIVTIEHTTIYRYANPVQFGEHRLMFRPRDSHDLRIIESGLTIAPAATVRWLHDVFGNSIAIATFSEAASELRFVSTLHLEHFPDSEPQTAIEPYAQVYPFSYSTAEIPDIGRTIERHYPDPEHKVDAWARQFIATDGPTDTEQLLVAMTKAIQANFQYQRRDDEGTQSPVDTLTSNTGTCRDFALLMMEAARCLGFAARFVSGYLYDETAVGGAATHAWVQIYLPGAGWVEYDPTNGLLAGQNLLRVAVAREPSQAIPLIGSFTGNTGDFLGMSVDVKVTPAA